MEKIELNTSIFFDSEYTEHNQLKLYSVISVYKNNLLFFINCVLKSSVLSVLSVVNNSL